MRSPVCFLHYFFIARARSEVSGAVSRVLTASVAKRDPGPATQEFVLEANPTGILGDIAGPFRGIFHSR